MTKKLFARGKSWKKLFANSLFEKKLFAWQFRDWSLLMPGTGVEGILMGHENFQAHNVGS